MPLHDANALELHNKLYQSNKCLQETLLKLNEANKKAKDLEERNMNLKLDNKKLK